MLNQGSRLHGTHFLLYPVFGPGSTVSTFLCSAREPGARKDNHLSSPTAIICAYNHSGHCIEPALYSHMSSPSPAALYEKQLVFVTYVQSHPETHIKHVLTARLEAENAAPYVTLEARIKTPLLSLTSHLLNYRNYAQVAACEERNTLVCILPDVHLPTRRNVEYLSKSDHPLTALLPTLYQPLRL